MVRAGSKGVDTVGTGCEGTRTPNPSEYGGSLGVDDRFGRRQTKITLIESL